MKRGSTFIGQWFFEEQPKGRVLPLSYQEMMMQIGQAIVVSILEGFFPPTKSEEIYTVKTIRDLKIEKKNNDKKF